jgi:beta-lactamase regulating signal transducer with metallopeptidase domain
MTRQAKVATFHFWLLIALAGFLTGSGLVMGWLTGQTWGHAVWQACQTGFKQIGEQLPVAWQLVIPLVALVVIVRAGASIIKQVRATRRLTRLFDPLRQGVPARVRALLLARRLQPDDVVFLELEQPRAFSLGFWRTRIWLTTGLVELLTDGELGAVLDHEAHHCRRRDPLRLLIGRALKSAFFFLPLISELAETAELQQELAADQAAIRQAGDDLPLLCALQKLLAQDSTASLSPAAYGAGAAYSPLNVTEARLRRLMDSPHAVRRPLRLLTWMVNVSVIAVLSGSILLSLSGETGPYYDESGRCTVDSLSAAQTNLSLLNGVVSK